MNGVEFVASWFTPTVLFCVMNLMIGTIFITSSLRPHKSDQQNPGDEQQPQLLRVPSLFERVKSFNLSRYRSEQPDPVHDTEPETEIEEPEAEEPHVTRTKSETVSKASPARMLKKSASEKVVVARKREEEEEEDRRRPATVREKTASYRGEDEAVDEKADDFINRFRQQLKLQRLDSILRYKEMLNRGIGR
ncbi:hypothetical protein BUALT_Bualt09G0032900 [Buddleja alternifolia]|uniref:DUF4408 domain-containing protein n=1 Tax=Buddleja alternifolia TaxID=168488 RepID=A0AAV6X059_9LAMI|nr:hypothetical protein BUALT_Bualt09G0032900 [Buddleja alternifolia]